MVFSRNHHRPHLKKDPGLLLSGRCLAVLVSALHSEVVYAHKFWARKICGANSDLLRLNKNNEVTNTEC